MSVRWLALLAIASCGLWLVGECGGLAALAAVALAGSFMGTSTGAGEGEQGRSSGGIEPCSFDLQLS